MNLVGVIIEAMDIRMYGMNNSKSPPTGRQHLLPPQT